MSTKYLVFSTDGAQKDNFDYQRRSAHYSTNASWLGDSGSSLRLSVEDGHEFDANRLRANPRNIAVVDAEAMLHLIAPTKARALSNVMSLRTAGTIRMPEGILAVNADTCPFTGQGVTVAVLDTGIDATHPAFQGKRLAMRDFSGDGDVTDKDGHGTHCAGTVCGAVVNDIRVGVAPGVTKLCIGKVIGENGGTLEMLVKAIYWAVMDEKASVVSMSLGYDLPGNTARLIGGGMNPALAAQQALRQQNDVVKAISTLRAFLETQQKNVIFVAASGNESDRPAIILDSGLPASELFSVGAVGLKDGKWRVSSFSNTRAQIVAPGEDVVSAAVGGGWASMSGTSMATPHVAGVAALWVEKLRSTGDMLIPGTLYSALVANAKKQLVDDNDVGAGMVQAPMSI